MKRRSILALPFAGEKGADLLAAPGKLVAVTPAAVLAIGQGDAFGFAAVPAVFGHADFLHGGFMAEGW